jgi:hypothetical protein
MKRFLLGGVAIVSAFAFQSTPTLAQKPCGAGGPCIGHVLAGHGPARIQGQHPGYARRYGVGVGVAAVATGVVIGAAIAAPNPGYYPAAPYPAYPDPDDGSNQPVYSDPSYVNSDAPATDDEGGSAAWCAQTYRSYDPSSGTYLGYDGFRHPCP